ncbi:unnamed protein product [Plutella xylostella]|uniref:(diamondback moth) hypothetical protein n=1 Tax=Plutella xylostella TaxID=51655 RepID=A0A8S4D9C5_PLUXY|nr:unnamed protein product [Plutella xylostella]
MPIYYGGYPGGPDAGGYCLFSYRCCNPSIGGCGHWPPLPGANCGPPCPGPRC